MADARQHLVLVADDDPRNRSLTRAYLSPFIRVIEASDAQEALAILEREPVDLVLLDVMMPGMDGLEACKRIKARTDVGFLPVILLTALADQQERNRGLEAGADDFLSKPVDRRELLLRVRSFLRVRSQDAQIRTQVDELAKIARSKESLLDLLIHDLRNPLSTLVASIDLATEGTSGTRQAEDLFRARASAEQLLQILDENVQLRLLEQGQLVARREPVAVRALAEAAIAQLSVVAGRRELQLKLETSGEAEAAVDARLVSRALENLLSNAVRHSPIGGTVTVSLAVQAGALDLRVCDDGPSLPEASRQLVFEKPAVHDDRGGRAAGLGLYFVRLVAQAHGGEAVVLDRPPRGLAFRMRLCAVRPRLAAVPAA